jgi:hypothetical protein
LVGFNPNPPAQRAGWRDVVASSFYLSGRVARSNRSVFELAASFCYGLLPGMVDLKRRVPATDEVEVDQETLAAIDRGIQAADEGRTVPVEDARKMISTWISRFESQKRKGARVRAAINGTNSRDGGGAAEPRFARVPQKPR